MTENIVRSKAGMKTDRFTGIFYAVLAAALYAASTPFSKLLLENIQPSVMASLLYLGAGFGMLVTGGIRKAVRASGPEIDFEKGDIPYIAGMIILDIAAPILLMSGLLHTAAANVSLLNNFEIVATSVIAFSLFREKISGKVWTAIVLITVSCILLSAEEKDSFSFSSGSVSVLLACVCWGFENNCTRKLSGRDPLKVVVIKGIFSGTGALAVACLKGEHFAAARYAVMAMLLGFAAYGLSIFFYIRAQKVLGAARTSAFYAVSPFIGTALSFLIFGEAPSSLFVIALIFMAAGTMLIVREK